MLEFILGLVIGAVARDYLPKLLKRSEKPLPPAFAVVSAAIRGNATAKAFVAFVERRAAQGDAEARRYLAELTAAFAYARQQMPSPAMAQPAQPQTQQSAPEAPNPLADDGGSEPIETSATTATAAGV